MHLPDMFRKEDDNDDVDDDDDDDDDSGKMINGDDSGNVQWSMKMMFLLWKLTQLNSLLRFLCNSSTVVYK